MLVRHMGYLSPKVCSLERYIHSSVLDRSSCKEWRLLKDQSIVVVLITFLQPHQRKVIH